MCRFVFYQGSPIVMSSLISLPEHSLIDQSIHAWERDDPLNGDGFGVAWYESKVKKDPALFKSVTPAWSNHNLLELSEIIVSPCILAHVRAATHGTMVSEMNCHPFKWRSYAFMHNGIIGGFEQIKMALIASLSQASFLQIKGNTDSEYFFALIIDEILRSSGDKNLVYVVQNALQRLWGLLSNVKDPEVTYLNFVLTNGIQTVVARITSTSEDQAQSLHFIEGDRYQCKNGVCRIINNDPAHHTIIFSSEPLNKEEGWKDAEVNRLYLIENSRVIDQYKL
jgi:glutamine amidotransferase